MGKRIKLLNKLSYKGLSHHIKKSETRRKTVCQKIEKKKNEHDKHLHQDRIDARRYMHVVCIMYAAPTNRIL